MADAGANPNPDQAWKALGLVNEWIRHADAKVGVTVAATGVASVLLFNLMNGQQDPSKFLVGAAVLTALLLLAGAVCGFASLIPRVRLNGRREPETFTNLLFYRHIGRGYADRGAVYVDALGRLTLDAQGLTKHIGEQVYANATVADRKYTWSDRAIRSLGLAAFMLALTAALTVWG